MMLRDVYIRTALLLNPLTRLRSGDIDSPMCIVPNVHLRVQVRFRIHDPSVSWVPAPRRPSYATPSTRPARALWIRGLNPMIHPLFREQATYPSAIPHNTATRRDARLLAGADAP